MNCIQFRRILMENPHSEDQAWGEHASTCPACRAAYERALAFEAKLIQALRVPVSSGLESRVRSARARDGAHSARREHRFWIAAAAGLILALGANLWVHLVRMPAPLAGSDLAARVVEHVGAEPELLTELEDVSPQRLQSVLQPLGTRLTGHIGKLTHVGLCTLSGRPIAHLVLAGTEGPVTVLIMPQEPIAATHRIDSPTLRGRVQPTATGSLAVVGTGYKDVDALLPRVQRSLVWGL